MLVHWIFHNNVQIYDAYSIVHYKKITFLIVRMYDLIIICHYLTTVQTVSRITLMPFLEQLWIVLKYLNHSEIESWPNFMMHHNRKIKESKSHNKYLHPY